MYKPAMVSGCLLMILAVIFGAFGAHYLKSIFTSELLASFETGIRYQFYHAFALLFLGLYAKEHSHHLIPIIFYLFLGGVILFSGSIYLLCIMKSNNMIGLQGLGILTPLGGMCFIIGWGLMLFVALSLKKKMGD